MPKQTLFFLATFSVFCFAGNSWLNRWALVGSDFDPMVYSWLRVSAGAGFLFVYILIKNGSKHLASKPVKDYLLPTMALTTYLWGFSNSYTKLGSGTGALVLFTSVQISLFMISKIYGQHISKTTYLGLFLALIGLFTLVYPNLAQNEYMPILLMTLAGIAWGIYTFLGKASTKPINDNAIQFLGASVIFSLIIFTSQPILSISFQQKEVIASLISGILCSAVGYAVWYKVMPNLAITTAALIQLLVPVITFMGGIIFLNESLTLLSFIALLMITCGVGTGVLGAKKK